MPHQSGAEHPPRSSYDEENRRGNDSDADDRYDHREVLYMAWSPSLTTFVGALQ